MQRPHSYAVFPPILTLTISMIFCALVSLPGTEAAAGNPFFLGIDIGGRNPSEAQTHAEYDYLSLCCQAGLRTVGQEFVSWNAIEPAPAYQGIHTYDWSALDQDVMEIEAAGGRFSPTLIPDAVWAVEVTQAESSPPKDGATCATANPEMGMSCWQAWSDFVGAVVERYDNDGVNDMPSLQHSHLYFQIGTEYENTEQWDTADGTQRVEKYTALLQTAYQAAKQANAGAKIISFSFNFGDGFDNNPTVQGFNGIDDPIAVGRREFTAQVFQQATDYFDIVGTNVNFHYNGIPARVRWIRAYVDKPIFFVDAATARLLDRQYLQPPLYDETVYPYMTETQIGEILVERDHAEHGIIKAWWEKEKAKYAIKKAVIAASQGVENIGFQFMFDTMGSNNLWGTISEMAFNIACGLLEWGFDYEPLGTAKPVYYTLRLFDERVGGFDSVTDLNPLPEGSDPTDWTWIIKFTKDNRDIFVLWSESGPQTLDLSSYFLQSSVTVTPIVTELDESNGPVYPDDQTVKASSIPVDEAPVFVQQTREYHHVADCTVCHYSGQKATECKASPNLVLIRDMIDTPYSGLRETVFGPYVLGEPSYSGMCEVCHELWDGTRGTKYYTNDGTGADHPEYRPGSMGPGECNVCHKHAPYEFGHEGAVGTGCDACHGQAGGPGTAFSHATHTAGDVPRGPATAMACADCHDGNNYPLFGEDDARESLAATTACHPCHSQGGAYDGVTMAKANWDDRVYSVDGTALESGKESWCATCHDDDGPTINGRTAKNVSGDDSVYGYFVSGHGKYNISCTDCHDPGLTHIDGYARTYDANEPGDPSRSYRNGYRLILVDGGDPLLIPRPEAYDSSYFALCYQCHREEAIVGGGNRIVGSPEVPYENELLQTYFANLSTLGDFLGNTSAPDPPNNIHVENHLATSWTPSWDSDRDTHNSDDSAISCPACHDPHSKSPYQGRATFSMTRSDLGVVYRREVAGWSAWTNTPEYQQPGGDLYCFACHSGGYNGFGPGEKFYFTLGTTLAEGEDPAFYCSLDTTGDIISAGGAFIGGSFAEYERSGTRVGHLIQSANEGCTFPVDNLNAAEDVVDFWYVPKFDLSGNTERHCLLELFSSADDYLKIELKTDNRMLFSINYNGTLYGLQSKVLDWAADTAHHIRCTWGIYGMHMYLDRGLEEYSIDAGTDHFGGIDETSLSDDLYVGRTHDGQEPADGIIDELNIYGYQYQKFDQPLTLFSRLGSVDEIENPAIGDGGSTGGDVDFLTQNPPYFFAQHGYALGIHDDDGGMGTYKGVVGFPTSNLNADEDTVDFWWGPLFHVADNTGSRVLFYCFYDPDNWSGIRLWEDRIHFLIRKNGNEYKVATVPLPHYSPGEVGVTAWYHVVCCWGPEGMHIYINDQEADYLDIPEYRTGLTYTEGLGTLPIWFMIGNTAAGADYYMDSMMDELRVYGYQETDFPQKPHKSADHAF